MDAYTVYSGAPADIGDRLDVEKRCRKLLDELEIDYLSVDHPHADTIAACEDAEKALGVHICKNLFLTNRQQTEFYLLLMPGDKPFKTKLLSKQLGTARLSFASPEHMLQYLGITPGSVSVLGLMNDTEHKVHLAIDSDLLSEECFGCHPCINTSSLKLRTEDVVKKFLPAVSHDYAVVELPWEIEE